MKKGNEPRAEDVNTVFDFRAGGNDSGPHGRDAMMAQEEREREERE